MKLETLFPVQKQVIPVILNSNLSQSIYPNDICVTAPTGSGKTLTYVLPIIQNLKNRIRPCCRAIVLLPVSDLAEQVYSVFKSELNDHNEEILRANFYANESSSTPAARQCKIDLKVMLLTNKHLFHKEQAQLVSAQSGLCEVDIVITTPGRLVDHILKTKGFDLSELKYLVLDECDRIMDQIKQNWLQILNGAVFGQSALSDSINVNGRELMTAESLNVSNLVNKKRKLMPYQKILLSATLTRDPEKFEQMKLFQPIFFSIGSDTTNNTSVDKKSLDNKAKEKSNELDQDTAQTKLKNGNKSSSANLNLPNELNELFIQVLSLQKPLLVIYLIKRLGFRRMLCFVKSKETAKRLTKLLELNGIASMEYSASLHLTKRKQIQTRFEHDELDVLVCSDVMARGMDLNNVDYVLLYDSPQHLSSYVHKVGRTARAGRTGTAITFLEHKEIFHFKKMMQNLKTSETKLATKPNQTNETGSSARKVREIKIQKSKLKPLIDDYENSLAQLKQILKSKNS